MFCTASQTLTHTRVNTRSTKTPNPSPHHKSPKKTPKKFQSRINFTIKDHTQIQTLKQKKVKKKRIPMAAAALLLPPIPNPTLPHFHRSPSLKTLTLTSLHLRRRRTVCCSSSSSPPSSPSPSPAVELPIFPLPLVLFPGAILPLQIFEFRYRIMMHTLLHSDLRFGVLFSSSESSSAASVGCVAEIVKHEKLADDRFFLIAKGQERFRINKVLRSKPYLVADVTWIEDRPPESVSDLDLDLETLASEVEKLMKDVIRLSNRLNGKKKEKEKEKEEVVDEEVDLRRGQFPTMFSFFVGSTFEGAPREQQALLEMEETAARLKRERETLRNTLNYLTAATAVKDVFPSSSSSS